MEAMQTRNGLLAAFAAAGTLLTQAMGGWDAAIRMLIAMMAADYLTGMLVAGVWHNSRKTASGAMDSRVGFQGILRKAMMLLVVYLGVLLDDALGVSAVRTAVILFFIGNEGLSLLENLGLMGVPFPAFLKRSLEALQEQGDAGKAPQQRRDIE